MPPLLLTALPIFRADISPCAAALVCIHSKPAGPPTSRTCCGSKVADRHSDPAQWLAPLGALSDNIAMPLSVGYTETLDIWSKWERRELLQLREPFFEHSRVSDAAASVLVLGSAIKCVAKSSAKRREEQALPDAHAAHLSGSHHSCQYHRCSIVGERANTVAV